MKKNKKPELRTPAISMPEAKEVIDSLSKATSIDDFYGKDGIFAKLFSSTIEEMLEAELSEKLGYEAHEISGQIQETAVMDTIAAKCVPLAATQKSTFRETEMVNFTQRC